MKITFINPNNPDTVDKFLPIILAEALLNQIAKEIHNADSDKNNDYKATPSLV